MKVKIKIVFECEKPYCKNYTCNRSSKMSAHLKTGQRRHAQLRKVLLKTKTLLDIQKTYVREIADLIIELLPSLSVQKRIIVKAEVPILNRRPDFVIYMPNEILILLEFKTTNQADVIRRGYIVQTCDTFRKFKVQHTEKSDSLHSMKLISMLLVRNPKKRVNHAFCLSIEDMQCRRFFL